VGGESKYIRVKMVGSWLWSIIRLRGGSSSEIKLSSALGELSRFHSGWLNLSKSICTGYVSVHAIVPNRPFVETTMHAPSVTDVSINLMVRS
jgi:hypothetical protein